MSSASKQRQPPPGRRGAPDHQAPLPEHPIEPQSLLAGPWGQDQWMERLLREADRAGQGGEVPVAAVVLDAGGRCLGWGRNRREQEHDPLGHAELVALRQAATVLGDWRFNQCTLLVTLEPCPMCAGALVQARMGRVIFAASDPKRGALGGCLDLANHSSAHHRMTVVGGVLADQAREQLESWFRRRRRERGSRNC